MQNVEEKMYACWLDHVPGLWRTQKNALLKMLGTPSEMYKLSENEIKHLLGRDKAEIWMNFKKENSPQKVYEVLKREGLSYTYYGENEFPKKLMEIPDAPFSIYYKGSLPEENAPMVAMIGARRYSEYGRCMAEYFADRLSGNGIGIISGMAMGIDGISQRAALRAGGRSYGVLGSGADVIYPNSNKDLYDALCLQGGVISESVPGTQPIAALFPQRNRIISALADVVLVVEAREKSGTSITVDMALEQGREVYVIPGRCTDALSYGCNKLLRQGANAAVTPEDILEDMGWQNSGGVKRQKKIKLTEVAESICKILEVTPKTQDEILIELRKRKYTYLVSEVCQGLLELEMKGIAERIGGQYHLLYVV
ncbi:MAG: DNA-processing protein DprA [Lachnospiraceae bacterium]|nr:DNA-processing protein DprA [Lachnospiraceae bacterium]